MNIIATCGTSIITNAKRRLKIEDEIKENELKKIILEDLNGDNLDKRKYGAEINAFYNYNEKAKDKAKKMFLIVSDTKEGRLAGEIINEIIINNSSLENIKILEIEGLNSEKQHEFAKKGLRSLAKDICFLIKDKNLYGENTIILPIGGFKAQIFIVGLLAQVFGIKSYYMFEGFNEIIELPPLPISFDKQFFIDNLEFFIKLKMEGLVEKNEVESLLKKDSKLKNLITEEKIDNIKYIGLSALGEILYEKLSLENKGNLPKDSDKTADEKEKIHLFKSNEAHARVVYELPRFKRFLRFLHEREYVKRVIINGNSQMNKGDQIFIKKSGNDKEGRVLHCKFNDKKGMLDLDIQLTENTEDKIDAAMIDIHERLNQTKI